MRVAIEGCGHGTLHAIYASVKKSCQINAWDGVDLLIIGGDFQAVRNASDLNTMSVPAKYREIGDFHEYYSGKRVAPYLTIFVGGNHEASSHLQELYYGGWVAKNIYYLGAANVIRFGGLRIAGLSGIWKGYNYNKAHFERLPYDSNEVKSLYHVRELDVRKLLLIRSQVDIGISHDWPRGIEWMGDHRSLFRYKQHFEEDAKAGQLGSTAAKYVMDRLRPPYWFAAHLHCKFAAFVDYEAKAKATSQSKAKSVNLDEDAISQERISDTVKSDHTHDGPFQEMASSTTKNEDEIDLDMDDESVHEDKGQPTDPIIVKEDVAMPGTPTVPVELRSQLPAAFSRPALSDSRRLPQAELPPPPPGITNKKTKFLALDKCLPNRKFLQILEIQPLTTHESPTDPPKLSYDPEWLAILRFFGPNDPHLDSPPNAGEVSYALLIQAQEAWVEENLVSKDRMLIPENFELTAPVYDGQDIGTLGRKQPKEYSNPQTKAFCEMLSIPNWFDASDEDREERAKAKEIKIEAEAQADAANHGRGRGRGYSGRGRGRGSGRGAFGGGSGVRGRGRGYR